MQYYGVTALARGLILAISPSISESAMKNSHGLQSINWQDSLSRKKFEELTVEISNGTFYEMLTATSNRSNLKHNSNGINYKIDFEIPTIGIQFQFSDLLQIISNLSEVYEIWTEQKMCLFDLVGVKSYIEVNEYEYIVNKPKIESGQIEKIFLKEYFDKYTVREIDNQIIIRTSKKINPQFPQIFFNHFNMGIGEIVLTKTISGNFKLNTLGQLCSLSFF